MCLYSVQVMNLLQMHGRGNTIHIGIYSAVHCSN